MQNNNIYLYNILLCSYFINYPNIHSQLGAECSLAYYLFKYSDQLFINYPRVFKNPSLVVDTYRDMNIIFALTSSSTTTIFQEYVDKNHISFKYLKYPFNIYHINHPQSILYKYNNSITNEHNEVSFKLLTVEASIAQSFYNYSYNYDLTYLMDACVLISIYIASISKNILLSYLLQLNVNVKKIMKIAMNSIKLLDFDSLHNFDIKSEECKQSIHSTIGFCYAG